MNLITAQQQLLALKVPIIRTIDAVACLQVKLSSGVKILTRLEEAGVLIKICRGYWSITKEIDPLVLPEYLTAPNFSYISLQTALFYHGMISQIPATTYAVSLARTKKYHTPFGTISIHHLCDNFFFGFEVVGDANIKLATKEKALLDFLYLYQARSLLFRALPELTLPKEFNHQKAYNMIQQIPTLRLQNIVRRHLEIILRKVL